MRRSLFAIAMAAILLGAGTGVVRAGSLADVVIIVHPSQTQSAIAIDELTKLFLKKTTTWSHGAAVDPIDQAAESPVKALFAEVVLGKKVSAINSYWQQQVFSGQGIPPEVKATDAEVVSYVKTHANAIGYVSTGTAVDGVKVLTVTK